jgi:hypothetical protein
MYVPITLHLDFERALYAAFPRLPLPPVADMAPDSWLAREAREVLDGKPWPEAVGYRLLYGEMDISLSIWMKCIPSDVFDYYVASHLMLASILIENGGRENYVGEVMEAFLLPPPEETIDAAAEIDDELLPDADVASYGAVRLDFYRRIVPAQRACIGQFLNLYLCHRGVKEFTEQGVRLFERNRDYWLHSSR